MKIFMHLRNLFLVLLMTVSCFLILEWLLPGFTRSYKCGDDGKIILFSLGLAIVMVCALTGFVVWLTGISLKQKAITGLMKILGIINNFRQLLLASLMIVFCFLVNKWLFFPAFILAYKCGDGRKMILFGLEIFIVCALAGYIVWHFFKTKKGD